MLISKDTVIIDTVKHFEYSIKVHVSGEYHVIRLDQINGLNETIFMTTQYSEMLTFMYGIQKAVIG